MLEIYVNLQNHYENKEKIVFEDIKYSLSGNGGSIGSNRDILVDICRYFYISNKFDQDFWNIFINGAEHFVSVEIKSINKEFELYELN